MLRYNLRTLLILLALLPPLIAVGWFAVRAFARAPLADYSEPL